MFSTLISLALSNLLYLALHIEGNGSFPKPLSAEKEQLYFELKAQGDANARNKLIEHNLRLVAHIAKKYYSSTNDQDDLISIGTIGLIKAVNTFTYDKGTRFATYAARCIENVILTIWIQKFANMMGVTSKTIKLWEHQKSCFSMEVYQELNEIENLNLE